MSPLSSPALLDLVALVGATVHTLEPGAEPFVGDVLIEDGRIAAVGSDLELAPEIPRYDLTGAHLVPGLIDGMVSFDPEHDALYVTSGVTCVRDMGGDASVTALLRDPSFRDRLPGPTLLTAGAVLDGQPPLSSAAVVIADEAGLVQAVDTLARDFAVDFLSIQPNFPAELAPRLGELADERGLAVWGMVPRALGFEGALEAGFDGLLGLDVLLPEGVDWTFAQPGAFEARTEALVTAGAALVPVAGEAQRRLLEGSPDHPDLRLLNAFYEAQWMADWTARSKLRDERFVKTAERVHAKRLALLARLHERGARLLPGSGAPLSWVMPGRSLLDELDAWVEAGVAPIDALVAATRGAAELLGQADERGRIAVGLGADLVALDADPREGLAPLRAPRAVCVRGTVLDRDALADLIATLEASQASIRAEQAKPLVVPELELPEGTPLLAGTIETKSLGNRLSAERFAAVRAEDGSLSIVGRLVSPASASVQAKQTDIALRYEGERLVGFSVRYTSGEEEIVLRGIWHAERLRLERKRNGAVFSTQSTLERPQLVTLDPLADSATVALALGQLEPKELTVMLELGPELEPVLDRWQIEDAPDGSRWIRSQQGLAQFRYTSSGLPEAIYRRVGNQETYAEPRFETYTTFDGPGLPVRFTAPATVPAPPPAEASSPKVEEPPR